jgi:hypothetical protein
LAFFPRPRTRRFFFRLSVVFLLRWSTTFFDPLPTFFSASFTPSFSTRCLYRTLPLLFGPTVTRE